MFSPQQLHFLSQCIAETRNVPGCIVEAGCAYGATTVYLNKFMEEEGIAKDYIAIDTFAGFVDQHADYEISKRAKKSAIKSIFSANNKSWFDLTMRLEGISRIQSVAADITKFNFNSIDRIAFCLLDVDLYLPIKDALPKIYRHLSSGGIIVVDDCAAGGDWDGAYRRIKNIVR